MAASKQQVTAAPDRRSLRSAIIVLILAGLILTAWRYTVEPETAAAPGDRLWEVELGIRADAMAGETLVEIVAPLNTRYLRVVGQNIDHSGWRQSFRQLGDTESVRRISFVASKDGELSINAVFSVHVSATPRLGADNAIRLLDAEAREVFLRDHPLLQIEHPEVARRATAMVSGTGESSSLPDAVYAAVRMLRERSGEGLLEVPDILVSERANARERAYTMVALCRAARIPARLVKGLVLREAAAASLHFWVEVYSLGRWVPYDPVFGYRDGVPPNYLPFLKGVRDVVGFSATSNYRVEYRIINADPLLDVAESTHADWREVLDLTRLPLDTRIMLAALMLLPFGALLTAVFNELIGVRSFGVFTPTLLALSLIYVPWPSAVAILSVVLLLGVGGRAVIPGQLSRVPRLSVVLTLVALGIGASASLMDYFDIGLGGQLVLLPIVILASMVDRFYSLFDEQGLQAALLRLAWTLALAVLCIPIIRFEALGHTLIRYPELHLVTLAVILSITLYSGKRLTQLPAFSWLDPAQTTRPKA